MFKRFITVLTVTALLFSIMSVGFVGNAVYDDTTLYGDINGDEKVDTEDARRALQLAAGVVKVTDEAEFKRADVNFDGAITLFDARQILRGAAGLATLQPSGAFKGFEVGTLFDSEEALVNFFNAVLNKAKVSTEESGYFAATITKTETDELKEFNMKEVELPAFSFGTSAEGIASMVKEQLVSEDDEDTITVIPYGETNFDLMSVEGESYVSNLSASDIYGARAEYDKESGELTIEIALPDTEIETAVQSSYAKVFNATDLIAEQDTTLMKLMGSTSSNGAMLREFKNCVLKLVVDTKGGGNIASYTTTFESRVYVSEVSFLGLATLKGIEFEKIHTVKYEDFQWPGVIL